MIGSLRNSIATAVAAFLGAVPLVQLSADPRLLPGAAVVVVEGGGEAGLRRREGGALGLRRADHARGGGQARAGPARLGRDRGLYRALQNMLGKAGAFVSDGQTHPRRRRTPLGLDQHRFARFSRHLLLRVLRILQQVMDHLAHLLGIRKYR